MVGLSSNDRKFLSMRAGCITFQRCDPTQAIDSGLAFLSSGSYAPAADGKFQPGRGPMETPANPVTCGTDQAAFTPSPAAQRWHCSVAHWGERRPGGRRRRVRLPLVFDASKSCCGVLARVAWNGALPSVQCGRLTRKAG